MKQTFNILFFGLLIFVTTTLSANEIVNGTYIGWKQIADLSPHDNNEVWFHAHKLTLKDDKATITAAPRTIKNGNINYSSSDGGFYTYEGKILTIGNQHNITIKITDCSYCAKPVDGWKERTFPIIIENKVTLIIDSVRYILQEIQ